MAEAKRRATYSTWDRLVESPPLNGSDGGFILTHRVGTHVTSEPVVVARFPKWADALEAKRRWDVHDDLLKALEAASGYLTNAKIDLETGAPKRTAIQTIEGGLKIVLAALTRAKS